MRFIRPDAITDSNFVSSSIAETEYPVYAPLTIYVLDDQVIYKHRIYKSKQNANQTHNPDEAGSAWWSDQGPTNMWAMFDGEVTTPSTASDVLTIVLNVSNIDSLALLNVNAKTISVSLTVGGVVKFSSEDLMDDNREVMDWESYLWAPFRRKSKLVKLNIPKYLNGVLTITMSTPSGTVSCGMLVIGKAFLLGYTEYDASVGISDYSKVSFDSFGKGTLIKRNYSPTQTVSIMMENNRLDIAYLQVADIRTTPVLWIGSDADYECLIMFGIYRDFRPVIKYPEQSICNLQILGMI